MERVITIRLAVIIPAYEPTNVLVHVLEELFVIHGMSEDIDAEFIVIDDGSRSIESTDVFKKISKMANLTVLQHKDNLGKGAALKTGFQQALDCKFDYVVTADADGQHVAKDIVRVAVQAIKSGKAVLGCRRFSGKVPLRSQIGNTVTRILFRTIFRKDIPDTQCGLRAFPTRLIPSLLKLSQTRYDYEFRALILLIQGQEVEQIDIQTVYEPGNPTSHFNPLRDSSLIYLVFLRYVFFVPIIAILDIIFFWLLSSWIEAPLAFGIVRSITLVLYFFAMRQYVFKTRQNIVVQSFKFLCLAVLNIAAIVWVLSLVETVVVITPLSAYILSNSALFAINFMVQKNVIFRE